MSKEGIATLKNVSMGSLCDPRTQEEMLNDLWFQWVNLTLELQLGNAVRRRFPGHVEGTYGRLARCIDELGFVASDVRFLAETRWRALVVRGHNIMAAVQRWGTRRAWAHGARHRMMAAVTRITTATSITRVGKLSSSIQRRMGGTHKQTRITGLGFKPRSD
jgi:hypothetical protein